MTTSKYNLPFDTSGLSNVSGATGTTIASDVITSDILNAISEERIALQNEAATVPPEAKTILISENGRLRASRYANQKLINANGIMPDIVAVHTYDEDGKDVYDSYFLAVKVDFADNTSTKAVCSQDDFCDLESGITICIAKKLIDMKLPGAGQSLFNKIIKRAVKIYDNGFYAKLEADKGEEQKAARAKKEAEKKRERQLKRAEAKREDEINIRKEAYVRAMKELYPAFFSNNFTTTCLNVPSSMGEIEDDLK